MPKMPKMLKMLKMPELLKMPKRIKRYTSQWVSTRAVTYEELDPSQHLKHTTDPKPVFLVLEGVRKG